MFASIPSPSSGILQLGPLQFTAYGLMIALGVIAAVELSRRRWAARGGDPEDVSAIALWAVPAGLVGARLYHLLTDWKDYVDRPADMVKIWEGGLGIPGGMAGGILVGIWAAKRRNVGLADMLDTVAPALPLAQAIGRWGNWWNQELFGGPTDLPWGLEIAEEHRPGEHLGSATFHPTFLYESLWNLALVAVLLRIDQRRIVPRGRLIGIYIAGYGLGRLWIEAMRIDRASLILGVRVNIWMSLALLVGGAAIVFAGRRRSGTDIDLDGTDIDLDVEGAEAVGDTSDGSPSELAELPAPTGHGSVDDSDRDTGSSTPNG